MNGMLAVIAGMLFVAMLLSYFPSMESPFLAVGDKLEDATGYPVDHTAANNAQSTIYGLMGVMALFGALTDAGIQPRRND